MRIFLAVLAVSVAGCPLAGTRPGDGIICTEVFVYGVNVTVTGVNDIPITGAILTLTDGEYAETMAELGPGTYVGAGERSGRYTLRIEADGYVTHTIMDLVVGADECHVIPITREVTLTEG